MITDAQAQALMVVCDRWSDHRLIKYRDWQTCCHQAARHIAILELNDGPRLQVLDLGGGLGYFAAMCRSIGHTATTLDLPDPFCEAAAEALGVPYIPHMLMAGRPLPGEETYDLITAIRLNLTEPDRWIWTEYEAFAQDILDRLTNRGRWYMVPNRGRNVDFVLDTERWSRILTGRAMATNPTRDSVLITKNGPSS